MERPWRRLVILLVATLVILPAVPAQAQGGADLSITMTWSGKGPPRAAVGRSATYVVTVTNLGPKDATDVTLMGGGSDHFDVVGGLPVFTFYATIPAGSSVTNTFVLYVCCFPRGETRDAFAYAEIYPDTPDPNLENNSATVDTRIIGGYGFHSVGG